MSLHTPQSRILQQSLVLLPLLLAALAPKPSRAELSYLDLKGIDALVDHPGASPVLGYTALKTGLENRRFLGNYGPKTPAHGCMDGAKNIRDQLVTNQDCPQDFTSEWLQRLFPSQDRVNFVANQIESDPISHLRPELMGRILQTIAEVPDAAWTDDQAMRTLERDLMRMMYQEMNPASYANWLKSLPKTKGQLTTEINTKEKKGRRASCTREQKEALQLQVLELQGALSEIDDGLYDGRALTGEATSVSRSKGVGKEADFRSIAHMIVGALKESRVGADPAYPKHLPEQALLAFFIQKKANTKTDLIELFKGMPKLIKVPGFLSDEGKQKQFVAQTWRDDVYRPEDYEGNPSQIVSDLTAHPEKFLFAAMEEIKSHRIPPPVGYQRANHPHVQEINPQTGKRYSEDGKYPDCGETSLRNFFNVILYKPKTGRYDADLFAQMNKKEKDHSKALRIKPELMEFYQNRMPGLDGSSTTRDAWSETVLPVAPDRVKYYPRYRSDQQCEINAGVDNMMEVIDLLIYHPASGASDNPSPLKKAATRADKIEHLCRVLARPGEELTWEVQGLRPGEASYKKLNQVASNNHVTLVFRINGKASFSWDFEPGHFAGVPLVETEPSWKDKIAETLAQQNDPNHRRLLPLVVGAHNFDTVTKLQPQAFEPLIMTLPLQAIEAQLTALRHVVTSEAHVQHLKPLAIKLKAKIEQVNDLAALQALHSLLTDANNPYAGDAIHALGKPDAVYTRVSSEKLAEKYGPEAANKMGRSWSREMFGHPVIIGDTLAGWWTFDKAREECIKLNPPDQQDTVRAALKTREDKLHAVRKAAPADLKEQLAAIHHANPIPGIYLMSKEEWDVIEADLGYQESRYIPQILPKLRGEMFWTSSGKPNSTFRGFIFYGSEGHVGYENHNNRRTVRCGAAGW